ncbi:MAG TPA: CYTH domain-containing protein, partial [Longimicrobium sp.]|nr:CYTH domain-containing protein [Longimicrobium sp.]
MDVHPLPAVSGAGPSPAALLRFEPAPGVLDALAADPPPPGLRAGVPRTLGFRDVYHDTADGDLEARGAWVCLRYHSDGARTLAVRSAPDEEGGQVVGAELSPGDAEMPLQGASEPARLLASLVDPDLLVSRLELVTHRRVRDFAALEGDAAAEVACDLVLVRDGALRAELGEVEVRVPEGAGPGHPVAFALRHAHGLRRVEEDRLERARHALREREMDGLEAAVRTARRVAVVAMEDGRVALRRERTSLRVPAGPGAGEEAARRVLRDCFGHDGARPGG